MAHRIMPMLHVPDVAATADWYESIGFHVVDRGHDGDDLVFAMLRLGESHVLLSAGGAPPSGLRRDADLYVETDDVEAIAERLRGKVDVVEDLHDTFYGAREFILRDLNGFWITFGQAGR